MIKKILPFMLAFLLSFAAMNTSEAGLAPTCESDITRSTSLYHENFMKLTGGVFYREILTGDGLQRFLEKMNATPPITYFTADEIYLYTNEFHSSYAIVLIIAGCVMIEGVSSKELVAQWRLDESINRKPPWPGPGEREA